MLFEQDTKLCKQDIKSFEQHIKSSEQVKKKNSHVPSRVPYLRHILWFLSVFVFSIIHHVLAIVLDRYRYVQVQRLSNRSTNKLNLFMPGLLKV